MSLLGYMAPMALALLIPGSLIIGTYPRYRTAHGHWTLGTCPSASAAGSWGWLSLVENSERFSFRTAFGLICRGERHGSPRSSRLPPPAVPWLASAQLLRGAFFFASKKPACARTADQLSGALSFCR